MLQPPTTRKGLAMSMSRGKRTFHDAAYGDPAFKGAHRVFSRLQKHAARCDDCTCWNECTISAVCVFEEEEKEKKTFPSNFSISFLAKPGLRKL
ncbi:hypothetical protein COX26_01805 [Candidatus Jorgensenbacteria bacterium CG23_combo_of_CG06-09_8_20_14_all_54_14]|uniref:Uncharacterized protein n=1 Tax=Candidatus Jorgensenbacteria bacterium CG23_combo_of_CG06-09_8_20_14_all_54_14 TaxID=1974595 RepID=A0A2G9Z9R6_9BACT|nr:MAG: hypothetical protein COX26_01805 [Candidatus Jorgensenbacteria bacterium CG23_combo_of_CG06-09_8_20_14_all_54_14]